jgi:hypothetical protein
MSIIVGGSSDLGIRSITQTDDSLNITATNAVSYNQAQYNTLLGRRFYVEIHEEVSGSTTNYYRFQMPSESEGYYVALQNRQFKSSEEAASLEILWYTSDYTVGDEITSFNENGLSTQTATMVVNEISEPTDLGTVRETDMTGSGGNPSSSSGGISQDLGYRVYAADSDFVLAITNEDNASQTIHVSYTWFELPTELFNT